MLQVWPISNYPDKELCVASQSLIEDHWDQFKNSQIIMQVGGTLPHSWLCPPYPIPGCVYSTPLLAVSTLPHSLSPRSSGIRCFPEAAALLGPFQRFIMLFLEIGDVQHFLNIQRLMSPVFFKRFYN